MVNSRDIWMPQRCRRPCFVHEPFACFRSALHPFRIDELQCNRPLERSVNRSIRHSHRAAAEFAQRSIIASLNPVISESIRYGRRRGVLSGSSASSNPTRSRHIMQRPRLWENPPSSRVPHSGQTAALVACACIL